MITERQEKKRKDSFIIFAAHVMPIVFSITALRYTIGYDGYPLPEYAGNAVDALVETGESNFALEIMLSLFVVSVSLLGSCLLVLYISNILVIQMFWFSME